MAILSVLERDTIDRVNFPEAGKFASNGTVGIVEVHGAHED